MWGTPILCYHHVTADRHAATSEFTVTAHALDRQMRLLRRLGFRSYTLRELVYAYEHGLRVGRAVVLTFDDGYRDTFATAAPILSAHGFTGTVYVVTQCVGQSSAEGNGRIFASWDELHALRRRGWEIGLHTATHADLAEANVDTLRHEVLEASVLLRQRVGDPVSSVAYPWGRYSRAAIAMVMESGARAAVTVSRALATARSPRYALPRYAVRRTDTLLDFGAAIATGYGPQSVIRFLRRHRLAPAPAAAGERGGQLSEEWWWE